MLQRLPIAFVQIEAGNNLESLLNKGQADCLLFVSIKRNYQKSTQ